MTAAVWPGGIVDLTQPTANDTMDGDVGGPGVFLDVLLSKLIAEVESIEAGLGPTGAFNFLPVTIDPGGGYRYTTEVGANPGLVLIDEATPTGQRQIQTWLDRLSIPIAIMFNEGGFWITDNITSSNGVFASPPFVITRSGLRGHGHTISYLNLGTPVIGTAALVAGGALPSGTPQFWVVTAVRNDGGETIQSAEVTLTPSGSNLSATIPVTRVAGACFYRIYRSTTSETYGATSLVAQIQDGEFEGDPTFTDTGTALTTGQPPQNGPTGNTQLILQRWASTPAHSTPALQLQSEFSAQELAIMYDGYITKRVSAAAGPGATPTLNTNSFDIFHLTALATAITSMTTNLSGTPADGDEMRISFTDNGTARAITWGAKFEASTVALPTTTVISTRLDCRFQWNTETSKWRIWSVA